MATTTPNNNENTFASEEKHTRAAFEDEIPFVAPVEAPREANPSAAGRTSTSGSRPNFNLTQFGNAERLVHSHGSNVRFCPAWKSWLVWDGTRWRRDEHDQIYRLATQTIRAMGREAGNIEEELASIQKNYAKRCESKSELDAMVSLAAKIGEVIVTTDQLDAPPMLLNCRNGVVDLSTGKLISHDDSKLNYLTRMAGTKYEPDAKCPLWLKFLDRIFDRDAGMIEYVQKIIGYSLTGQVSEKALFLFHGDGNNGKTTLLETIRAILGDYAGLVEIESLMKSNTDDTSLQTAARLYRKRFVTASEVEEGHRFNESRVKKLTGMGRLTGRLLYSNPFEFDPEFKLFIDANHRPGIKGTDEAIWIRMRLIPFRVKIPDAEIDKNLMHKLRQELPGILTWAVRGCLKWQKDGLEAPTPVASATAAYRADMDVVRLFLTDCCERDADGHVGATELYGAFTNWCARTGQEPVSQTAFGTTLGREGFERHRVSAGNIWRGIRLWTGGFESVHLADIDPTWPETEPARQP